MKKRKICLVTLHRVFNYGSVLQAYATCRVFEKAGYEVELADYVTEQRTNRRLFLSVPDFIPKDFLHRGSYLALKSVSILLKKKTIHGFLRRNVPLSGKQYVTADDLAKDPPQADLYVTGSDQVWNSQYNEGVDRGFFLDFAPEGAPRFAYVSSFGKTKLEGEERQQIKRYLEKFTAISVREDAALEILRDLGLEGTCLVDPTLQLTREEWLALASKRLIREPYLILMLIYNEDEHGTEYARKLADQLGLKLVKISWELRKPPQVDVLMSHRSPEDFLSLFAHAEFVVTNSFHGLAFSINFNRPFVVVPRKEFNSRIESLLRLTGLERRMVTREEELAVACEPVDYETVNARLDVERRRAEQFVKVMGEPYD